MLLACSYAGLGDAANAIVELDNALAFGAEDASTLFNAACTLALLGRKAEALSTLKQAVRNGYWHFDSIARDPDFASLHDEPEFQELIGRQNASSDRLDAG